MKTIIKILLTVLDLWVWIIAYEIILDNGFLSWEATFVGVYFSAIFIAISIWVSEIKKIKL